MKLNSLKPNPDNPRTISKEAFERLKGKIKKNPDGLTANKIVHKEGIIIAGNQRWRVLQELKLELKDEWFKDVTGWTDEQIKDWLIDSNISDGEWDWDILANQYEPDYLIQRGIQLPYYLHPENDLVNKGDENSEWVGMPEFGIKDDTYKLIIQFNSNNLRDDFSGKLDIDIVKKGSQIISAWFPKRPDNDVGTIYDE